MNSASAGQASNITAIDGGSAPEAISINPGEQQPFKTTELRWRCAALRSYNLQLEERPSGQHRLQHPRPEASIISAVARQLSNTTVISGGSAS
eukprot:jgi/Tetstr1/449493/TSEL_036584.t1